MPDFEVKLLKLEMERKEVVKKYGKQMRLIYIAMILFILSFTLKRLTAVLPETQQETVTEIESFSEN